MRGVDADAAGGGEVGGPGAGEAEQPGDGGVDPLALEAVGHRAAARRVSHRRRLARGVLGVALRRPCPVDADAAAGRARMISPAAATIAMSATLKIGQCGRVDEVDDVARGRARARGRSGR